jgi:hypothetical protein
MIDPNSPEEPRWFRPWTDQIARGIVDHENLRHATCACAACLAGLIDAMREVETDSGPEDYREYCLRMRLTFTLARYGDDCDADEEWFRWWWEVAAAVFEAYNRLAELDQRQLGDLLQAALTAPEPGVDIAWLTRFQMANACWYLDSLAGMMSKR